MYDQFLLWLQHFLYVTMRWLHIVCTTLLVGGTLFFEFVLPIAIEDLKHESQLGIFGKARWVFRRVVLVSAILLVASGVISLLRSWDLYRAVGGWVLWPTGSHVALGVTAIVIAWSLIRGGRPPERPLTWMRINLGILVLAVLAANIARDARLSWSMKWTKMPLPGIESVEPRHR